MVEVVKKYMEFFGSSGKRQGSFAVARH